MKVCARKIFLAQGKYALVDAADYNYLSQWKWCLLSGRRESAIRRDEGRLLSMHRALMGAMEGIVIDHINNDPLDNRRSNLRPCTNAQNMMNKRKYAKNKSGYKGVLLTSGGRWKAQISVEGRCMYLGTYDTAEEAAKVYDELALYHYGEFASLNFAILS